tara:strand:+ start:1066 stop:1365 length:300 start_codon:yes stop_codon:yes gene_type:complete
MKIEIITEKRQILRIFFSPYIRLSPAKKRILPPRNPNTGSNNKYANEIKNPIIMRSRGAGFFLSVCLFVVNKDWSRSENDRIAKHPVIIQGKKDGWVVF